MVTATQVDREHLTRAEWLERETRHQQRADALTAEHRERAARGEKHPVWDFLFTYYSYKPAVLRKWHPGAGVVLAEAPERTTWRYYSPVGDSGAMPSLDAFRAEKPALLDYTTRILSSPMNRTGQFGCFIKEWRAHLGGCTQHKGLLKVCLTRVSFLTRPSRPLFSLWSRTRSG